MKKVILSVFLILNLMASVFCSGKKDEFSLEQIEHKYPSSKYIVGLGQGVSLNNAQSTAKLALCQTLGEFLKGEQTVNQSSFSDGKDFSSMSVHINEKALFEHITGIQIKETLREKKTNEWVCVAVLDRAESSMYYQKIARENDLKISQIVDNAQKNAPSMMSVELMNQALLLAQDNQHNLDLLSAINSGSARSVMMTYGNIQSLKLKLKEIASKVSVNIKVQNDKDNIILNSLTEKLLSLGISVTDGESLYIIPATVKFERTDSLDGKNVFVRYNLEANMMVFSSQIVKSFTINGREGHLTYEQAVNRCYTKIANRIRDEF